MQRPNYHAIPATWPANPHYGSGQALRALQLTRQAPDQLLIGMEDMAHAFRIELKHDDQRITGIRAQWIRRPLSSCVGADAHLSQLAGLSLQDDLFNLSRHAQKNQHCTHMFDMLVLAVVHAYQGRADIRYDVLLPDNPHGPVVAVLLANGHPALQLTLDNYEQIIAPAAFAGRSIYRGFLPWAQANLPAPQAEYAYLMQKTLFIARGQLMDVESLVGDAAINTGPPADSCFGTRADRYQDSVRLDTMRRFSADATEQVLHFMPAAAVPSHTAQQDKQATEDNSLPKK